MEGTMVLSEQKTARNGRLHQLASSAATIKILLTGALTGVLTGALTGVILIIIIFSTAIQLTKLEVPSNSTSPIWSNAIEHLQTLLHCRRHVLIHKLCKCSIDWYGLACLMHQIMG